jgi:hypothetical protein
MHPQITPDNRYIIPWPPVVWYSAASGKTFAGAGGTHIEVDAGTTVEDIEEFFCWGNEARKYWKCECRGFQFRQDCKHIQNLKIALEG